MKKILTLFFGLILTLGIAVAQTNYYPEQSGVLACDGFSMEYTTEFDSRVVYNSDQRYVFATRERTDGEPMSSDMVMGRIPTFNGGSIPIGDAYELIKDVLSDDLLEYLQQEVSYHFTINITMESSTGEIEDVYFIFGADSRYTSIPPQVLHEIETVLKKNLRFTMTEQGKQLTFGFFSWTVNFHDNFLV